MNEILKITLPIYYTINKKSSSKTILVGLNEYRNQHFQILSKMKAHYHDLIISSLAGCRVKKLNLISVHVAFKIYLKRNGTDGGNVRSVIEKFTLDAIKEYGLIKDDTFDIVKSDNSEYFKDAQNPRAEITVYEIPSC